MELDQILQLIDKVSDSSLTAFDYEADGIKIAMEHGKAAPVQVQMSQGAGIPSGVELRMAELAGDMANVWEKTGKEVSGNAEKKKSVEKRSEFNVQKVPEIQEMSDGEEKGIFIVSPLVGTFYAAPSEDGEPFVKVGDTIRKGQVVAIVEAMKLMNEIESEVDGVVTEILVKNGEMVDYGKPLFRVKE